MMEYLEFMFRGPGHFFGSWIIIGIVVSFVFSIYNRTLKFIEVLVRGYKPQKTKNGEDVKTP